MSDVLLLLPDFVLIVCGFAICRWTALKRPVWDGVERLVYYLLFPALLFVTILRSPLQLGTALPLAGAGLAVVLTGIVAAYALRLVPGVDSRLHASGAQTAFRFNTYIALALAERLGGAPGLAGMALIVAVCVPLANVGAVWPLARHGGQGLVGELARNPLLLATVAGLGAQTVGLVLPEWLAITLTRMGSAALPLGLMAVGAGLTLGALREAPRLAAALLGIRHLLLPLVGIALALHLPLGAMHQSLVVTYAALPTASSAYVLAVRMGGHGGFVAGLVTVSTLIAMPGLPLALALWQSVR